MCECLFNILVRFVWQRIKVFYNFSCKQNIVYFGVAQRGHGLREGTQKKRIYLGLFPKQRTPPTHPYSLGLSENWPVFQIFMNKNNMLRIVKYAI